MKQTAPLVIAVLVSFLLSSCTPDYSCIPGEMVYDIVEHGDSLYFSTMDKGIYRFSPSDIAHVARVSAVGRMPFRALTFLNDTTLYAASYMTGLRVLEGDSLVPVHRGIAPAWDMSIDDQQVLWLAGEFGVHRFVGDSIDRFLNLSSAHDVIAWEDTVAVAHANGVSFYDRNSKALLKQFATDTLFWSIERHGTTVVAGGKNVLLLIRDGNAQHIPFGPHGNIAWQTAIAADGTVYLATQMGFFRYDPARGAVKCIGEKGHCVKSVEVARDHAVWIGRYYRH